MGNPQLRRGDVLEVRISDLSRRMFYKMRVNLLDKKKVVELVRDIFESSSLSLLEFLRTYYSPTERENCWH